MSRTLVARLGPDQARRNVSDVLVEEIARILRLPRDDVSKTKPLTEIGVDSLMGVELMLSLENRFAMDAPLGAPPAASVSGSLPNTCCRLSTRTIRSSISRRIWRSATSERPIWGEIAPLMTALKEKGVDLDHASRQSATA